MTVWTDTSFLDDLYEEVGNRKDSRTVVISNKGIIFKIPNS